MSPDRSQDRVGSRPDATSNQWNRAEVGSRFFRLTPQQIGHPDVQGMHQPVQRLSRKEADSLENIVHVRLGNAAHPGQPPFGQLTGLDSFPRNPDQLPL